MHADRSKYSDRARPIPYFCFNCLMQDIKIRYSAGKVHWDSEGSAMRRSEINRHILRAKGLLERHNIALPPFAAWGLEQWREQREATDAIRRLMLGWDITDYGKGCFEELGAVLFTLRNGSISDSSIGTPYAEKLIVLKDGQRLPLHCHASKTEDIINRAGGIMAIQLYSSMADGRPDMQSAVQVDMDGIRHTVPAGETVLLGNGESITLRPGIYHLFRAEEGSGDLICGEVSTVNDDLTDNCNAEPVSRFASIEEDDEILHPLCNEYERVLQP